MTSKAIIFLLFFLSLMQGLKAFSQVKIAGPECIVPGTEYQYDFYGQWDKQSEMNVCVEGGLLARDNTNCYSGKAITYIRVIWNDETTKGKISVTTSSGSGSYNIKPTRVLQGGKIDSTSKLQLVQSDAIPRTINCAVAKGGNCSSSFAYQWEQSDDNLHWTEITGSVFKDLSFPTALNHTVFFRRRIFDSASNSVAYSDIAIVAVDRQSQTK
jgi:hypothetical protein